MTPDELKSMPKGSFIVAKTGVHPMKVKLRLFLDWGIRFGMPYEVPEKAQRFVAYADKQELEESIIRRHYGTIVMVSEQPQGGRAHPLAVWLREFRPHRIPAKRYFGLDGGKQNEQL